MVTADSEAVILGAGDGSWQDENDTGTLIWDTRSFICEVPARKKRVEEFGVTSFNV